MPYSLSRMACASCSGRQCNGQCCMPQLPCPTGGVLRTAMTLARWAEVSSVSRAHLLHALRSEDCRGTGYVRVIVPCYAQGTGSGLHMALCGYCMEPSSRRLELPIS